jgi:hypothetical protein
VKKQKLGQAPEPVRKQQFASEDNNKAEDEAFAAEFMNTVNGSKLAPPKRTQSRQKTVRQSNANKVAAEVSTETSTTGADADDDRSPSLSPELPPADGPVREGADVSDMLEPAAAGPSVLRLTEPENKMPARQKPAPKAPKQEESKKQRQNKKKAEEKRLQHEEDEKLRRVQLEKQLRTAREARGEPAKNGMGAPAPTKNAWTESKPATAPSATVNGNGLLDTFSSEKVNPATRNGSRKVNGTNGSSWQRDLPSEEEQLRMIMEDDESAWKTVSKKSKKARKNTTSDGEKSDSGGAVQPVEMPKASLKEDARGANTNREDGFGSPLDSTWSVA